MKKRIIIPLLLLAAFLALPLTAQAEDPPDTLTFEATGVGAGSAVAAFRDLLADGDLVVTAQYNIAYATLPADSADVNFIGRVLELTPLTTLGINVPYPFNDAGYGKGVISWYLSPDETAAAGYTTSGVWNEWPISGLAVDLSTNPTVFDPADQRATTASGGSISYSSGEGTDTNREQLATKIIAIARGLEADWGVSLVDEAGRLNATGGTYFQLAIPGSLSMAPNAFGTSSTSPNVPTPAPTVGGPGTLADTAEHRFDGVFWLTPALNGLGATIGLPAGAFQGILSALLIALSAGIGLKTGGSLGAVVGFALGAGLILPVFSVLGFISWAYGAFGMLVLVVLGIVKISRHMD